MMSPIFGHDVEETKARVINLEEPLKNSTIAGPNDFKESRLINLAAKNKL